MADLLRDNDCIGCDHYDSEANDFYYQWCTHPNIDDENDKGDYLYLERDDNPYSDFEDYVIKCPIDGRNPYE